MTTFIMYDVLQKKMNEYDSDIIIQLLYEGKITIPTEDIIQGDSNKKLRDFFYKSSSIQEAITQIKHGLSKIDNIMPLYDSYRKNLFLVARENVYDSVITKHMRFPSEQLLKILAERNDELDTIIKKITENNNYTNKIFELRVRDKIVNLKSEKKRIGLLFAFLDNFDMEILEGTYTKVFYFYANEVGKNIIVCKRPSFIPNFTNVKPYYSRSEVINLALNMKIIRPDNKYYTQDDILDLCAQVQKNDINSEKIIEHQEHILLGNKIGLIQYYSFQGSYFINKYMRGQMPFNYRNSYFEKLITSMWELVITAPPFNKEYTLYRFVNNDEYLSHLKVGDIYVDPTFISTTRDPFYRSDLYKFGFILIKIKIPAAKIGTGLAIESYSHFSEEQEIILPPLSELRLDNKDENASYYHTNENFVAQVITKYEFTFLGSKPISYDHVKYLNNYIYDVSKDPVLDFLKLKIPEYKTIHEKIYRFLKDYVNPLFQFKVKIGETEQLILTEWYDSTNAYKKFYGATTQEGFCMYSFYKNYISFVIEMGEMGGKNYMYVNYYFKYSSSPKVSDYSDYDFIVFISKVAYFYGIKNVVIYCEYISCDMTIETKNTLMSTNIDLPIKLYYGGNYCVDFYDYFKYNKKRFKNEKINSTEIYSKFTYYALDRLKKISPKEVLKQEDRDELYQLYDKIYFPIVQKTDKDTIADFYVWLAETNCSYIKLFVNKIKPIYGGLNNPFSNDYYILDSGRFLYNNNFISQLPDHEDSISYEIDKNIARIKNEYRLEVYKKLRVPIN